MSRSALLLASPQAQVAHLDLAITVAVQVITMPWNARSRRVGLADHDAVESVATIEWRAHSSKRNYAQAARLLGMPRRTLGHKVHRRTVAVARGLAVMSAGT